MGVLLRTPDYLIKRIYSKWEMPFRYVVCRVAGKCIGFANRGVLRRCLSDRVQSYPEILLFLLGDAAEYANVWKSWQFAL